MFIEWLISINLNDLWNEGKLCHVMLESIMWLTSLNLNGLWIKGKRVDPKNSELTRCYSKTLILFLFLTKNTAVFLFISFIYLYIYL